MVRVKQSTLAIKRAMGKIGVTMFCCLPLSFIALSYNYFGLRKTMIALGIIAGTMLWSIIAVCLMVEGDTRQEPSNDLQ